ncbi:MAG: sigma-54 dependent transcriptional regulator [Planctomycetota bacterium]
MPRRDCVLIVDDEADFRENVVEFLSSCGHRVLEAANGDEALAAAVQNRIDAAAVDLVMPGMNGIELLEALKKIDPFIPIVILTGQGEIESAVAAMRKGAFDYVAKPARLDEIEAIIARAVESSRLTRQNRAYRESQERSRHSRTAAFTAVSGAMQKVMADAQQLGKTDFPVLIEGETGAGKEVVAEFIHSCSDRREMPLTTLNCAALPQSIVDAELFGHEKGSFTGATQSRPGLIEIADRGTLLLDEIGDMPAEAQARLLRFLEKGVFRPVGGRVEKTVDVRVLAATNRDLEHEIRSGRFRQDLYHRLAVYRLSIPALRARPDDILPLAEAFIENRLGGRAAGLTLSPAAKKALLEHDWPGNVRELRNTIERAIFVVQKSGSKMIEKADLGLPGATASIPDTAVLSLKESQNRHVARVLELAGGDRKQAAELLGVSERQLYRLLKRAISGGDPSSAAAGRGI